MNDCMNQSIHEPIVQPINPSTHRSINQSIHPQQIETPTSGKNETANKTRPSTHLSWRRQRGEPLRVTVQVLLVSSQVAVERLRDRRPEQNQRYLHTQRPTYRGTKNAGF